MLISAPTPFQTLVCEYGRRDKLDLLRDIHHSIIQLSARTLSLRAGETCFKLHTGTPLASIESLSTPQAIQSSVNSSTLPYGLKYSRAAGFIRQFLMHYLIGEGILRQQQTA